MCVKGQLMWLRSPYLCGLEALHASLANGIQQRPAAALFDESMKNDQNIYKDHADRFAKVVTGWARSIFLRLENRWWWWWRWGR